MAKKRNKKTMMTMKMMRNRERTRVQQPVLLSGLTCMVCQGKGAKEEKEANVVEEEEDHITKMNFSRKLNKLKLIFRDFTRQCLFFKCDLSFIPNLDISCSTSFDNNNKKIN
jgi:hypothetical protein